ncbi:MAG: winged helix-turn-helix transcriptional regulator [Clostridia bacterium]|nr:winged helix-turn-helix transcriptional regulator [Clostridia bacterium]
MANHLLTKVYNAFRLAHYRALFGRIKEKPGSLSATESFSVDVIYLLNEPTIKQFSEYLGISQPNATYKINSLIAKGYVEKIPSEDDKREFRLRVSDRFHTYFANSVDFLDRIDIRLQETLTPEEYQKVADILAEFADDIPMESNQQKE